MQSNTYTLKMGDETICNGLTLEFAVIFTEAIMNKYYLEPGLTITIEREIKIDN